MLQVRLHPPDIRGEGWEGDVFGGVYLFLLLDNRLDARHAVTNAELSTRSTRAHVRNVTSSTRGGYLVCKVSKHVLGFRLA